MQNDRWNEMIFNGIKAVNKSLYQNRENLTARASTLLNSMEYCLCSGDGLSIDTAFHAANMQVIERVLGLMGLTVSSYSTDFGTGVSFVFVGNNPFDIERVFFTVEGEK